MTIDPNPTNDPNKVMRIRTRMADGAFRITAVAYGAILGLGGPLSVTKCPGCGARMLPPASATPLEALHPWQRAGICAKCWPTSNLNPEHRERTGWRKRHAA